MPPMCAHARHTCAHTHAPQLPLPRAQDGQIDYVEFCALMRNTNEGLRKSAKVAHNLPM